MADKFEELELVELVKDGIPKLPVGIRGTIVHVYDGDKGFEVEFYNSAEEYQVETLLPEDIKKVIGYKNTVSLIKEAVYKEFSIELDDDLINVIKEIIDPLEKENDLLKDALVEIRHLGASSIMRDYMKATDIAEKP